MRGMQELPLLFRYRKVEFCTWVVNSCRAAETRQPSRLITAIQPGLLLCSSTYQIKPAKTAAQCPPQHHFPRGSLPCMYRPTAGKRPQRYWGKMSYCVHTSMDGSRPENASVDVRITWNGKAKKFSCNYKVLELNIQLRFSRLFEQIKLSHFSQNLQNDHVLWMYEATFIA